MDDENARLDVAVEFACCVDLHPLPDLHGPADVAADH